MAMVNPITQTLGLVKPEKLGVTMICLNSSNEEGIGNETKCSFAIANELPETVKISFKTTPSITATSAPGINFNFLRKGTLSHIINIIIDKTVMIMAPNCT